MSDMPELPEGLEWFVTLRSGNSATIYLHDSTGHALMVNHAELPEGWDVDELEQVIVRCAQRIMREVKDSIGLKDRVRKLAEKLSVTIAGA